jgi:hypothetical protein
MMEPLNKVPSQGEREGTKREREREEDPSPREKIKTQSGSQIMFQSPHQLKKHMRKIKGQGFLF